MCTVSFPGKTKRVLAFFANFLDSLDESDLRPPSAIRPGRDFLLGPHAFACVLRDYATDIGEEGINAETLCLLVANGYRLANTSGTALVQLAIEKCNPNRVLEPIVVSLSHPCNAFTVRLVLAPASAGSAAYSRVDFESSEASYVGRMVAKKLSNSFSC